MKPKETLMVSHCVIKRYWETWTLGWRCRRHNTSEWIWLSWFSVTRFVFCKSVGDNPPAQRTPSKILSVFICMQNPYMLDMYLLVTSCFIYSKVQDREKRVSSSMYKKFQDDRMISADRITALAVVCSSVRCHCLYECACYWHTDCRAYVISFHPWSLCLWLVMRSPAIKETDAVNPACVPRLDRSKHTDRDHTTKGITKKYIYHCCQMKSFISTHFSATKKNVLLKLNDSAVWFHLKHYEKVL